MIKLKENQVKFNFHCLQEEADVVEEYPTETVAWIRNQLERGNEYAFFKARVCAYLEINTDDLNRDKEFDCISHEEYLGCLSYENEKSFLASEDYACMRESALTGLNQKLNSVLSELLELHTQGLVAKAKKQY